MISIYFTQKLEKRLKLVTEDEKKMPVLEALHSALIPSDESDEEGDVLRTKPLEWRSEEVSCFFHNLDSRCRRSMSNQQKRQSVNRRVGPPSTRGRNEVPESLLWAIKL